MAVPLPHRQANLLSVPQEIRDSIYSFVDDTNNFRRLWVCRQLYEETRQLFYDGFALDLDVFADCRRPLEGGWHIDGTPKKHTSAIDGKKKISLQEDYVRHVQHSGMAIFRRLRKVPRGALLKHVHILVSTGWGPSTPEGTWCSFCLDDSCTECGQGLVARFQRNLRSTIDPQILVKVYYHLDLGVDPTSRAETRVFKKIQLLSIFEADRGLPQCKTLTIYCSVGVRPRSNKYFGGNGEEWRDVCNLLARDMRNGSSLEHLEIWVPGCIFDVSQNEASNLDRRRYQADFLGFDRSNLQEYRDASWLKVLQTILSLKSIKYMVWNDQERPSQQSVPVKPLGVAGLDIDLDS
ncbi:MAG: hypothetical protein Q9178_002305 [Gyalolechia marmorata]